jgi:hypothetical protein
MKKGEPLALPWFRINLAFLCVAVFETLHAVAPFLGRLIRMLA